MDPILLIVGAGVSLATTIIKKYVGTTPVASLASVIFLSLVAAGFSSYLQRAGMWESTLQILAVAGSVYGLITKNIQDVIKGTF